MSIVLRGAAAAALFALLLAGAPASRAQQPPATGGSSIDRSNFDTTCAPCKDFFRFANGGWAASHPIPPSYARYGSFDEVADRNQAAAHSILEDAAREAATADPSSNVYKLGTFYGTCMDSTAAEALGAKPLEPQLARIAALKSPAELGRELARMSLEGVRALFLFGPRQDLKHSDRMIATASQGGLGLPDRDYYLKPDSASRQLRQEYVAHIARMFQLLGSPEGKARADAGKVLQIETALARASMTRVQRRDAQASYHVMTVGALQSLAPSFDWKGYFETLDTPKFAEINVGQPAFFRAADSLLRAVPIEDWRTYLTWHATNSAASLLSSAFVDEDFHFSQLLTGAKVMQPRWKRCMRTTDGSMGELLGQEYIKRTFDPQAKSRVLAMVTNLESVLKDHLSTLPWMGDSTRLAATAKLAAFTNKIAYPDHWRDYSDLKLERGSFYENARRAGRFEMRRQLAKIGKPVDRTEWGMTPPTVNASYSPNNNDITFPAGILQPPFFDPKADDAALYGGIGTVIGHEMTHGFDDEGRKYDGQGNLRDWWTAEDEKRFRVRADRVIEQFNGYVAVDSLHVNGRLTTGENIADLGGVAIAFEAYERSLQGNPRPVVEGFTPEQRFFLAYATIWRESVRPERARVLVGTDPHSPPQWRVNGPLSNLQEFAKAFGCKKGDPMVRPDSLQARIW